MVPEEMYKVSYTCIYGKLGTIIVFTNDDILFTLIYSIVKLNLVGLLLNEENHTSKKLIYMNESFGIYTIWHQMKIF